MGMLRGISPLGPFSSWPKTHFATWHLTVDCRLLARHTIWRSFSRERALIHICTRWDNITPMSRSFHWNDQLQTACFSQGPHFPSHTLFFFPQTFLIPIGTDEGEPCSERPSHSDGSVCIFTCVTSGTPLGERSGNSRQMSGSRFRDFIFLTGNYSECSQIFLSWIKAEVLTFSNWKRSYLLNK